MPSCCGAAGPSFDLPRLLRPLPGGHLPTSRFSQTPPSRIWSISHISSISKLPSMTSPSRLTSPRQPTVPTIPTRNQGSSNHCIVAEQFSTYYKRTTDFQHYISDANGQGQGSKPDPDCLYEALLDCCIACLINRSEEANIKPAYRNSMVTPKKLDPRPCSQACCCQLHRLVAQRRQTIGLTPSPSSSLPALNSSASVARCGAGLKLGTRAFAHNVPQVSSFQPAVIITEIPKTTCAGPSFCVDPHASAGPPQAWDPRKPSLVRALQFGATSPKPPNSGPAQVCPKHNLRNRRQHSFWSTWASSMYPRCRVLSSGDKSRVSLT